MECPRESTEPGTCPSSWVVPGCSHLGVFPLPAGGLLKSVQARLPSRVTASLAQPHPRLGFYLPPHTPVCGGTSRGSSVASVAPSSTPFCALNRGEFHFFCVSLLRPFVFKDAAGQMEGDLFAHLAQGSEKGTPWAREETSRNTVLPGRRPEDACNSRGQVTPSALASAPPSALPAHPWYWSVLF